MSNKLFNVAPPSHAAQLYHAAEGEKKESKDNTPFLDTTMGKVSLGLAAAAVGAGAVYLYNKSQSDK